MKKIYIETKDGKVYSFNYPANIEVESVVEQFCLNTVLLGETKRHDEESGVLLLENVILFRENISSIEVQEVESKNNSYRRL